MSPELADQGCEMCDHMLTDEVPTGEEMAGQPAHFWVCGECCNAMATRSARFRAALAEIAVVRFDTTEPLALSLAKLARGALEDAL